MTARVVVALGLCISSVAAAAECRLDGRAWIVGQVGDGPLTTTPDAHQGEKITAWLVLPGTLDKRRVLFSEGPGKKFTSWSGSGCGALEVSWRRVEPTMVHTTTKSPNRDLTTYSNAVIFGPHHGEWIGYDTIEYFETALDGSGLSRTLTDAHPSDRNLDVHGGLGVMRLAATITAGTSLARTAGSHSLDGVNLSDRVFRYTFRSGDDFLGWLTSFFNVPYLFGSAGHKERAQAERYLGADCADVLTAALRRAGRRDLDYSSVAELTTSAPTVAGPIIVDGSDGAPPAAERLAWGKQVQPGDLLVIDYVGWEGTPRQWDHVLVAVEDRGVGGAAPDGFLGPEDLVADSGDATGLLFQPLARQGKVKLLVLRVPLRRPGS